MIVKEMHNRNRFYLLMMVMGLAISFLICRVFYVQILGADYYLSKGDARYIRDIAIPTHRGVISDRNGEPLAISTPVLSAWINPKVFDANSAKIDKLAKLIGLSKKTILSRDKKGAKKEFVYLKRQINPDMQASIEALEIAGLHLKQEFRRYYPEGVVASHVVGFTDIDDKGSEGIELAYDKVLRGEAGVKRVVKDRLGHIVEQLESIRAPRLGMDIQISIDRHIQTVAYRELTNTIKKHGAKSGSVVVLDTQAGEVLAMANYPSYNPNRKSSKIGPQVRNRAVTDVLEPGSVIKPFVVASALEAGVIDTDTYVDTAPGRYQVGKKIIRDKKDLGLINVATVLQKSSNVGATKIAMSTEPRDFWNILSNVGFGSMTGSGFPGEVHGVLRHYTQWSNIDRATLAYGYGIAVTPLQLAQAYSVLANRGVMNPISFIKNDSDFEPIRVISKGVAQELTQMLEGVTKQGGTGMRARVPGYRVAGKTGTAKKLDENNRYTNQWVALFAGFAPVSDPRVVIVVTVDSPSQKAYYGGLVAAPVFANVMSRSLRYLNVMPDDFDTDLIRLARSGYD